MQKKQVWKWAWLLFIFTINTVMLFMMLHYNGDKIKSNGNFEGIFSEMTKSAKDKVAKAHDVTKGLFNSDERAIQIAKNKAKLSKQVAITKIKLDEIKKVAVVKKEKRVVVKTPQQNSISKEVKNNE